MKCLFTCALFASLAGCFGDFGPKLTAQPSHVSSFGYVDVTFSGDIASLGDITDVVIGGEPAYNFRATPTSLTVTVQGAPVPGSADVDVTGTHGRAIRHDIFSYDAPKNGVPIRWMAFGASLTQGTESEGIDEHTQTFGVAADIARAAGVYLALPILDDKFFHPLEPTDFLADCTQKPNTGINFPAAINLLTDPATGFFDGRRARLAWMTTPRDLAIGGSKVSDTLHGAHGNIAFLEHLVETPDVSGGDLFGAVDVSQIQRLEQLDPDVAFSTDLLANDLDGAVTESDDLHFENVTDLLVVQPLLVEMMGRLGKLHGQYFIANMPSFGFVPNVVAVRARRLAAGTDTAASFDAKVKTLDDLTDQYNAALVDAMRPYANLHLVDFKAKVDEIKGPGIRIGGELLTTARFGGLLSLDNLHFTDTGYGNYANVFLQALNQTLGLSLPLVDLEALHAADELTPTILRADGLTCVPPPG